MLTSLLGILTLMGLGILAATGDRFLFRGIFLGVAVALFCYELMPGPVNRPSWNALVCVGLGLVAGAFWRWRGWAWLNARGLFVQAVCGGLLMGFFVYVFHGVYQPEATFAQRLVKAVPIGICFGLLSYFRDQLSWKK